MLMFKGITHYFTFCLLFTYPHLYLLSRSFPITAEVKVALSVPPYERNNSITAKLTRMKYDTAEFHKISRSSFR
jgi:hypothetical protein